MRLFFDEWVKGRRRSGLPGGNPPRPIGYIMQKLRGNLATEGLEEIDNRAGKAVEELHYLCKEASDAGAVILNAKIFGNGLAEGNGSVRNCERVALS